MSHIITMYIADQSRLMSYLSGDLDEHQQRTVRDYIHKDAREHQASLDRQGIDLGLSIPDALDHLLAGRPDADGDCVGNAYYGAMRHIIANIGSDPIEFGVYSKPSTFFGLLDDELRRAGVPADLLPHGFLYADLPDEIPFSIPSPLDGYPAFGRLPLAKTEAVADAYTAVLEAIDSSFVYDTKLLIKTMQTEHDEWQSALQYGHTMDTIFFSIQG
ncbi:hypothetical protein AB0O76_43735 [Streptomyces sp. NPDC086554]|uniref:DUF7691 family protein n=1 Tax=Streptomyces sp. NPDC086554 TaxID=3154864 RepID=UPI00344514F4